LIGKMLDLRTLFNVRSLTAVITGGSGQLGRTMAHALAQAGVQVAVVSLHAETSGTVAEAIQESGGQALGIACDVLDRAALERTLEQVTSTFGPVDMLINAAGGNHPQATTTAEQTFFDLDMQAVDRVFGLNFAGTFQCCQVFGRGMAARGQGCIINVASMNALRPLTRIPAYSAAKAAVANFTQWLAVHMAQEYSPRIRVNSLAPGFFLTEQNRFLMIDAESGDPTPRGAAVLQHTPMGRLGEPDDLVGTLLWLVSPASAFVTGIVVPVDGGFSAFSGV
jgi:NAD(P)-dependent dehydrogenase (short-subunit alcohol dehydrogenase family)